MYKIIVQKILWRILVLKYLILLLLVVVMISGCDLFGGNDIPFDEKTIFFAALLEGDDNSNIFAMTPDGDGLELVIEDGIYPRLSPDATKIVFVTFSDGDAEIYISNIDGSERTKLTDNSFEDNRPFFNHAGTKIIFESYHDDGDADLFTMDLSGGNLVQLTNFTGNEIRAEFSPDDTKITYSRYSQIWVMDADGQNSVGLLPDGYDHSWGSHWSPDGTQIAFTRFYGDGVTNFNGVYVIDSDGANLTLITDDIPSQNPYWSPDGTEIVFTGHVGNKMQIFKINSVGGESEQLLNTIKTCFQPYWKW